MKYTCIVVDNQKRERPLITYTDSLAEARRWGREMVRINPEAKVEIYETRLMLMETISNGE